MNRDCVSFPSKSTLALPTPCLNLVLDPGLTAPGRRLPQRQPRFQKAAQSPQFPQTQHPIPNPNLSTQQPFTRSGTNTQINDLICGCFWAEPWTHTQAVHRFAVTLPASLASAITSSGVGHALKDNGAYWSPTLRGLYSNNWGIDKIDIPNKV